MAKGSISDELTAKARRTRPAKMPYDPSHRGTAAFMVHLNEAQLTILDSIRDAIETSPDAVANGYTVSKASAARSVFDAGLKAVADKFGIDPDAVLAAEQAKHDAWISQGDNAALAKAFRASA